MKARSSAMRPHIEVSPEKKMTAELRPTEWVGLNQLKKGVKGMFKNVYPGREHGKKESMNKGQCGKKKRNPEKPKI